MNNKSYSLVILLLLVHLFIRVHHVERQEVFVDEAYHVSRAAVVYDFDTHPARFAHGKLLLYFYLGLFEREPYGALPTVRLAIALFSLLNGAVIYLLGCQLHSQKAGVLALGLYAVLPFAFFFERMALADSFAGTFAGLVAWRSLVFVKKPSYREGAILGVLLLLMTLAKLTSALVPFLPALAALIYTPGQTARERLWLWVKTYWPPLILAAAIIVVGWLPILIPAALAMNSDNPFILVDPMNLQQLEDATVENQILGMISAYTSWVFLGALLVGWLLLLKTARREALFILTWLLLLVLLSLVAATKVRTRYLMPAALPSVLALACGCITLWNKPLVSAWVTRGALLLLLGVWLVAFVFPFVVTDLSDPAALDLNINDWLRYMSGNFSGEAARETALTINQSEMPMGGIYAAWGTCQVTALYTPYPIRCLASSNDAMEMSETLKTYLERDLGAQETAYLIKNSDVPRMRIPGLEWKLVASYSRPFIDRNAQVWEIRWAN